MAENKPNYIQILDSFDLDNIPDLDTVVLGALELFEKVELPALPIERYKRPLVVGSGNAEAAGRIIFSGLDAIFASESNYEEYLKRIEEIDCVIIVSAYAGKHAPIIARTAKEHGKRVVLITNNPNSLTKKEINKENGDEEFVFPKNREPYTYNTSNYMGMILSVTKENPSGILEFLTSEVGKIDFDKLGEYGKFFIIVPPKFARIRRMLQIKFIELFGRQISRDIETMEFMSHAMTLIPSKELFISIGCENEKYGDPQNRMHIPLPTPSDYGTMMAVSYFVIGQIQKRHPRFFKENIGKYMEKASSIFNDKLSPIVEK